MRRILRLSTIVVATGSAVLATAAAVAVPAGAQPAGAPAGQPAPQIVRLITGDTLAVRAVGGHTVVSPLRGSSRGVTSMHVGTHQYVFPPAARYYAPTLLDPALFDVSTAGTASIPVDVSFTGARPDVPGLTVTSASSTALHGVVTAAGAQAFGAALRAQWQRDLRAGVSAPATLFGATRIALHATPAVHPDFPQVTLIIDAVGTDGGKPKLGTVGLVNTDDGRRYTAILFLFKGQARVSVPLGNYSLIGEQDSFTEDGDSFSFSAAIKTIPDFAVTQDTKRITVDFRDATVRPSISTPQPATLENLGVEWQRTVPNGGLGFSFGFGPADKITVAPAPAPVHGTVDWVTNWDLNASPPRSTPIRYDASYDDQGAISADQSHVFVLGQAGRVDANFYTDGRSDITQYGRTAYYPFDFFIFLSASPLGIPTAETQYALAPSDAKWLDIYDQFSDDNPAETLIFDEPHVYPAGSRQRIDWLRGPLAGGVPRPSAASDFFFCPGCRTDDRLGVFLVPLTDTTPGHNGYVFSFDEGDGDGDGDGGSPPLTNFTLYRDGKKIVSAPDGTGASVNAPPGDALYRAVLETDLGAAGYLHSTHAVTDLTFHSAAGAGGALPGNWICSVRGDDCRVLPLLTATVPLPTDLRGNLPVGTSRFVFTLAGAGGGPTLTVPAATMSISVAGGPDRTVPVTALGAGRFSATVTHPTSDAGKLVSLKVAGADTQGDSITESVTDAYAVANS